MSPFENCLTPNQNESPKFAYIPKNSGLNCAPTNGASFNPLFLASPTQPAYFLPSFASPPKATTVLIEPNISPAREEAFSSANSILLWSLIWIGTVMEYINEINGRTLLATRVILQLYIKATTKQPIRSVMPDMRAATFSEIPSWSVLAEFVILLVTVPEGSLSR